MSGVFAGQTKIALTKSFETELTLEPVPTEDDTKLTVWT